MSIARASHNEILLSLYRYVAEYFNAYIYSRLRTPETDEAAIDRTHEELLQAIRSRNRDRALDCVNQIIGI